MTAQPQPICTSQFGACCHGSSRDDNLSTEDCATEFERRYGDGSTCNDPGLWEARSS